MNSANFKPWSYHFGGRTLPTLWNFVEVAKLKNLKGNTAYKSIFKAISLYLQMEWMKCPPWSYTQSCLVWIPWKYHYKMVDVKQDD